MTDKIVVALIAAVVSLVGVAVSLVGTWISNRASRRRLHQELEGNFSQFIYKERLESFAEAFRISGKIKRQKAPQYLLPHKELRAIAEELLDWSSGKGGLLMSGQSIKAFQGLYDGLRKPPGHGETYAPEQAEKIWRLRSEFRRALREDVLFLSPPLSSGEGINKHIPRASNRH